MAKQIHSTETRWCNRCGYKDAKKNMYHMQSGMGSGGALWFCNDGGACRRRLAAINSIKGKKLLGLPTRPPVA